MEWIDGCCFSPSRAAPESRGAATQSGASGELQPTVEYISLPQTSFVWGTPCHRVGWYLRCLSKGDLDKSKARKDTTSWSSALCLQLGGAGFILTLFPLQIGWFPSTYVEEEGVQ